MGSTIIKIFSGEHASEPPKTALAQILWGGLFCLEGGLFRARSPLRKFLRAPMDVHRCNHFMQEDDPVHRSRVVKKWLKDNHVPVLECPRNFPDLNPIENACNYMKNKGHEAHFTNIQTLKEVLMKLWVPIYAEYFRKFAESMPNILHNVIKAKGHKT